MSRHIWVSKLIFQGSFLLKTVRMTFMGPCQAATKMTGLFFSALEATQASYLIDNFIFTLPPYSLETETWWYRSH